jgi:uncharacterized membrane protein YdjX (TVP38/TMEM64 family)
MRRRPENGIEPNKPRGLKALVVLIVTAFFVFAPPGTLIVAALVLVGLFGKRWMFVVGLAGAVALVFWLLNRARHRTRLRR